MKAFHIDSVPWRELWEKEKQVAGRMINFGHRLWLKMNQDDILFLASGLAFNVILCLIPILLLLIYVLGIWFQSAETIEWVDRILETAFPNQPHALSIRQGISSILAEIVSHRASFGFLSILVLMVASASLFSSIRSILDRVFEIQRRRSFVISYLVDLALVLGLTLLILLTVSLSWIVRALKRFQDFLPPLAQLDFHGWFHGFLGVVPDLISVGIVFLLCYLLYRCVPAERPPRRVALVSAVTTSLVWEISARLFAWYLGFFRPFGKLYGAYAFILVLMIWVFYSSVVFIMGAEVGKVLKDRSED